MSSRVIRSGTSTPEVAVPLKFDSVRSGPYSTPIPQCVTVIEAPSEDRSADSSGETLQNSTHVIAQLEKNAWEQGFREGQKSVSETGEKSASSMLEQFSKSLEELRSLRRGVLSTSEREVIRLALEVARKIVKREITIDEEIILTLVRVALKRVSDQTLFTVRLNPKDCSIVKRHQSMGNAADILNDGIRLAEDPLISRGGCVIETESGLVDARVEEQFREIEKGFLD